MILLCFDSMPLTHNFVLLLLKDHPLCGNHTSVKGHVDMESVPGPCGAGVVLFLSHFIFCFDSVTIRALLSLGKGLSH